MTDFPPQKHMQSLRNLIAYYHAYYVWQTNNPEIRKWEMRRAKVSIMLAAICYRMAAQKARNLQ